MADIHYISPRLRNEAERLGIIGSKAEYKQSDYVFPRQMTGSREWEEREKPVEGWWRLAFQAASVAVAFYVLWLVLSHVQDVHVVMGVAR